MLYVSKFHSPIMKYPGVWLLMRGACLPSSLLVQIQDHGPMGVDSDERWFVLVISGVS